MRISANTIKGTGDRKKAPSAGPAARARQKFLRYFPRGFADAKYVEWERGYKWKAHERWEERLNRRVFRELLDRGEHSEIASRAVSTESPTNLIFSYEKMALRDAVRSPEGAEIFARGLFDLLHGRGDVERRFARWVEAVAALPRRQSRVLTHPLATVFGFLAQPDQHIFLKPTVTRAAAKAYGYDLKYTSRPSWETYNSLLGFARVIREDLSDVAPADMIDIQSFIWVLGSSEYP